MFAPNPVEALLRHAQGNDDVHIDAVVLLRRVFERSEDASALVGVVVHQISDAQGPARRSEEHTSELQSLMRSSYAVFCLKKKTHTRYKTHKTRLFQTKTK